MAKCRPPHLVQILLNLHRFRAGKVVVVTNSAKTITRLLSPAAAAGGGAIGGAVGGGALATEPCAAGKYNKYEQNGWFEAIFLQVVRVI